MADDTTGQDGSFNEDELSDIMSEIENLEKDFKDDQSGEATNEPVPEPVADVTDDSNDTITEEALSEIMTEEVKEETQETVAEVSEAPAGLDIEVSASSEKDDLQATIDAEIAELNAITDVGTQEEDSSETSEVDNVVNLVQPTTSTTNTEPKTITSTNEGTFSGSPVEFTCNGEMNLNMNFNLGEKTATLTVDKEGGLTIQLDGVYLNINEKEGCTFSLPGGIKFTVPLTEQNSSANKKAS